jgi:dTDP-glucose 4,6-dehydratase
MRILITGGAAFIGCNFVRHVLRSNTEKQIIVLDRPDHYFRYSLNWDMIRKMGWKPQMKLEGGLRGIVDWYVANEKWWPSLV